MRTRLICFPTFANAALSSIHKGLLLSLAIGLASWPFFLPLGSAPWISSWGLSLLGVSAAFTIVALEKTKVFDRSRALRCVANGGAFSYSIYLWHIPLNHLFHGVCKWLCPNLTPSFYFVTYFLVAIGGGIALGQLIEMPVLAMRDKWFPSKS
jgi:peptidoglycan/LPS O-acetylase OafA/YrhL